MNESVDNLSATSGRAAFSVINTLIMAAKSQSTARHLKTHASRMPLELISNGKGKYGVKNFFGVMNGEASTTRQTSFPKEHQIDEADLDLQGLTPNEDGSYYLYNAAGFPWDSDDSRASYLGVISRVFRVPTKTSRRVPPHKAGFLAGQ